MWKKIRIALLLLVLVLVAGRNWLDHYRTTSWHHAVTVGVFPLNADGSAAATATIGLLNQDDFEPIGGFLQREAHRHGLALDQPVVMRLFPAPAALPPALETEAGLLARVAWSLRLRWYTWRVIGKLPRAAPTVALFLLYHDPASNAVLPHSAGMQRGLMGIVHVFASIAAMTENNIVITHELLHTFGATDKYDLRNDAPLFPAGYADPQQSPRFPQTRAEIMAGRMAQSASEQLMPATFDAVIVGPETAGEIGWGRAP